MKHSIVWFRRDLRVTDNPALSAALANGSAIAVYIHAPDEEAPWQPGAASNWWLHHSLTALQRQLDGLNIPFIIAKASSADVLLELAAKTNAQAVYWNRLYEPACIKRDAEVTEALAAAGINSESFNSQLLFEPHQVANKQGGPFKVFTPFWRHYQALMSEQQVYIDGAPRKQESMAVHPDANARDIDKLNLLPSLDWADSFYQHWKPGEAGALSALSQFIETQLDNYKRDRDYPALGCHSKLSPHLHFGEIGPRQVWTALAHLPEPRSETIHASRQHFLSELAWREFAHHLLVHFPHTPDSALNPKYQQFPWWHSEQPELLSRHQSADQAHEMLRKWQQGETGISMVDAGMQELWQTGFMHNRLRMLVASLLTKNMGIHWREGAQWFWDTLVDANLANNTLGWQWAAGCGADAAPYFRIFNPDTQAQRFDESQAYRHRWLAEGWQQATPCLDLKASRAEALEVFQNAARFAA